MDGSDRPFELEHAPMTERIRDFLRNRCDENGPCLVVDLDIVRDNYVNFAKVLPDTRVFYAVKANPAPEILELLAELGACFDVASVSETQAVLAAGAAPERISYGNTIKKETEIATAFGLGVTLYAVDCEAEVEKIARAAPSLFQVMTNLLLNAIALSPEGSSVRVETAVSGADARLSVIDSGPGVDSTRRPTIFGGGHTTRSGGAGVGLRHAHALASSSGGKLSLGESERGARFDVRWPLLALRPPMSRISSMPGLSLEGVRILLLEDDDAVIGLLSTALSLRGASVHAARNSGELEIATQTLMFDAALLDLSPIAADIGGALARLQTRSPKAKLVLISGSAAEVPAAAQGIATAWVRKPFEVGEILAVLRSFSPLQS